MKPLGSPPAAFGHSGELVAARQVGPAPAAGDRRGAGGETQCIGDRGQVEGGDAGGGHCIMLGQPSQQRGLECIASADGVDDIHGHRFGGSAAAGVKGDSTLATARDDDQGGAAGPQLNALGGRFSVRDIAEAIIEPGKVVSDQYSVSTIEKNDGTTVVGKIVDEKDGKLIVAMNPFDMQQHTEIAKADVKATKDSTTSPMPPALINRLNEEELKDLLAFLLGK